MMLEIKIAIIDDHTLIREGLKNVFKNNLDPVFSIVGEFENGEDFLSFMKNGSACDVAIMDLHMPGKGGLVTLQLMTQLGLEIRSVVLSMGINEYVQEVLIKNHVFAFLPKESATEELIKAVVSAYYGEMYFNETFTQELYVSLKSQRKARLNLTLQEIKILELVVLGKSNKEISELLFISPHTVKTHRERALKKTNTHNVMELYKYAIDNGIIQSPA